MKFIDLLYAVRLYKLDEDCVPVFEPQRCANCDSVLRGSMFANRQTPESAICEECYRLTHYGDASYTKRYKHCILSEAITPPISRKMCRCEAVSHVDSSGEPRSLFPVEENENHFNDYGAWGERCNILRLGELVAKSKYRGLQATVKPKKPKSSKAFNARPAKSQYDIGGKDLGLTDIATENLYRFPSGSSTSVASEAMADGDIPLFFRRYTERYPFGNVHMALRIGPLVIENGVSK